MSGRARATRAFTLIEVLLALALLAGIAGGALGLLEHLTRRQAQARAYAERVTGAGLVIDRLERALATSIAQGADGSVGIRGDAGSIEIQHLGVVGHANAGGGALRSLALRWSAGAETIEASFDGLGAEPASETLCEGVERARFRYFQGSRWRSSFDSVEQGGLPSAIEVAIWFSPPGHERRAQDPAARDETSPDPRGDDLAEADPPTRRPDRLRVVVIPDAPEATWEVGG